MSKVKQDPNGFFPIRIFVPNALWDLLSEVGERIGALAGGLKHGLDPGEVGARLLLERLNAQVINGDLRGLSGPEWEAALGKVKSAGAALASTLPADFDRSVLHTDTRLKSGYYGVITYGYGYQARGRHPSGVGEVVLGTSNTAEKAALARYYYYLGHEELAYGEAELEVEAMRKIDPSTATLSDNQIWPIVENHIKITGRYHEAVGPGTVSLLPGPRQPQIDARKQDPNSDAAYARGELFRGFATIASPKALAAAKASATASVEPVALGFEDGDLPACFNDDWTPGDPNSTPIQPEPVKRKRGRPRKHPLP